MKLEHRGTKILEKLISVPPRLLERLEYMSHRFCTVPVKTANFCFQYQSAKSFEKFNKHVGWNKRVG